MNERYTEIKDVKIIQKLLFLLLDEFHRICEENNLVYNIAFGTLLGAVRHQDIIPWDDDIDVTMPRADYEKFIKIAKNIESEKFCLYCYPDENYIYPFGKFALKDSVWVESAVKDKFAELKIYLDIFPMDGIPEDRDEQKKHFKKIAALKRRKIHCVYKADCKTKIKEIIKTALWRGDSFPYSLKSNFRHYLDKEIKLALKYDFDSSKYVTHVFDVAEKGVIKKEDYLNRKLYKLGKHSYWGVADYDSRLKGFYGDYMTPPPKDKRVTHHNYKVSVSEKLLKELEE